MDEYPRFRCFFRCFFWGNVDFSEKSSEKSRKVVAYAFHIGYIVLCNILLIYITCVSRWWVGRLFYFHPYLGKMNPF